MNRQYTSPGWDFCLQQPLLVMRSYGEPELTSVKVVTALMLQNGKTDPKKTCFWPLYKISTGQFATKKPKLYNWAILNQIFKLFSFKNTVILVSSWIIQNLVVSLWYNHLPFFRNVETQVKILLWKMPRTLLSKRQLSYWEPSTAARTYWLQLFTFPFYESSP